MALRKARPGGRTAETKKAVFAATEALLAERPPAQISMTDIAARAGVAATSIYRRWGDPQTLLMEVAVEQLMRDSPLPDTGSLAGDLGEWAAFIARGLASPSGSMFFRVYVATAPLMQGEAPGRTAAVMRRIEQIAAMLERAAARGEPTPPVLEVTDHLLGPLYMRAIFGAPADEAFARSLVTRLLERL
jgi:AcrR family transcriptional regulator